MGTAGIESRRSAKTAANHRKLGRGKTTPSGSVADSIVGLGSVGSIVAEGLARTGIRELVLIDHDIVKPHNLDRMLNTGARDIGRPKTDVAEEAARRASAADEIRIVNHRRNIRDKTAYAAARDCDISGKLRRQPIGARCPQQDMLQRRYSGCGRRCGSKEKSAKRKHERCTLESPCGEPYTECLRCKGQYTSSDVMLELDGSWRNPDYIKGSVRTERSAENVFCLSLSAASEILNMTLRMPIAEKWWPEQDGVGAQSRNRADQETVRSCHPNCSVNREKWTGDYGSGISYLIERDIRSKSSAVAGIGKFLAGLVRTR